MQPDRVPRSSVVAHGGSRQVKIPDGDKKLKLSSMTLRSVLPLLAAIAIAEAVVHGLLIQYLQRPTGFVGGIVDSIVLAVLVFPILIFFVYRPLSAEVERRRESEEEIKTIFHASPFASLAVIDPNGIIRRVNRSAEKIFGYEADEMVGKPVEFLLPERVRALHQRYRAEYMKAPTARPMGAGRDLFGLRKDGTEVPLEIALTPVLLRGETVILTSIADITARKALEAQRDEAVEGARVGIWDWDIKADLLVWSERCKALFSLNSGTTMSHAVFLEAIKPEDRERVDRAMKEALRTKRRYEVEIRIPLANGETRWVMQKGRAHYDSSGNPTRMSGIALDITERKEAEERLRASEGWFRKISDALPTFVWTADPAGNINYVNQQALEYLGMSPDEVHKWGWANAVHSEDRQQILDKWKQALASGAEVTLEYRLRRFDGIYHWFAVQGIPIFDSSGNLISWLGSSTDIDVHKTAVALRNELIGIVSHDLRNPLSAIAVTVDMLARVRGQISVNELQARTASIRRAIDRMQELISNLLDVTQIEFGTFTITPSVCLAETIVQRCTEDVRSLAEQRGITIFVESEGLNVEVVCDADRIAQVFSNLLSNAMKFVSEGQGMIVVRARSRGEELLFEIQDNGQGISPEAVPHIFERFWAGKDTKKAGIGLGLAISQGIVKAHRGGICVESEIGRGSTFYFTLLKAQSERGRELLMAKGRVPGKAA